MSHTPGPWKSVGGTIYDSNNFEIANSTEMAILLNWDKEGVGHWSRKPGITYIEREEDEVESNCKLIAQAPALLEALKELLAIIDAGIETNVIRATERQSETSVLRQARAAIAAAEDSPARR